MTDLPDLLRSQAARYDPDGLLRKAADELERLQREADYWQGWAERYAADAGAVEAKLAAYQPIIDAAEDWLERAEGCTIKLRSAVLARRAALEADQQPDGAGCLACEVGGDAEHTCGGVDPAPPTTEPCTCPETLDQSGEIHTYVPWFWTCPVHGWDPRGGSGRVPDPGRGDDGSSSE